MRSPKKRLTSGTNMPSYQDVRDLIDMDRKFRRLVREPVHTKLVPGRDEDGKPSKIEIEEEPIGIMDDETAREVSAFESAHAAADVAYHVTMREAISDAISQARVVAMNAASVAWDKEFLRHEARVPDHLIGVDAVTQIERKRAMYDLAAAWSLGDCLAVLMTRERWALLKRAGLSDEEIEHAIGRAGRLHGIPRV
jgi:hypothetical protein